MTSATDKQHPFDRDLQQLHAAAVRNISADTLARLRVARHGLAGPAPRHRHAWRWIAAAALPAILAVAIGVQFLPLSQPVPGAAPVIAGTETGDYADSVTALDENPDLYLWLASPEALPLAME